MTMPGGPASWLLLLHQLPARPAYARVKAWRRLNGLGAVAVRNGVYALPARQETREDLDWVRREIVEDGGDAVLCDARWLAGLDDSALRRLFDAARDEDYRALAGDVRAALSSSNATRAELARLRGRLAAIAAIDFFVAPARAETEALIDRLEAGMLTDPNATSTRPGRDTLIGKLWVTRAGVRVDRIASAWLVRRFIDPDAVFAFVPAGDVPAEDGAIRFDMYAGEFGHVGDRCTFEVLIDQVDGDARLQALAEIIHDIDLKDGKFGRAEVAGVRAAIDGICLATDDDAERLARGAVLCDALYAGMGSAK